MEALLVRISARASLFALATIVGCSGCQNDPAGPPYEPVLPSAWAAAVTNPFFPLLPGTVWRYQGATDEGTETIVVEVLAQTRTVNGVAATVVRDRVYLDGELTEDTDDWFAQDAAGNVWYLGENSKEVRNGVVVGTEGSWEWGKDDALPGIVMWADPSAHVGEAYRQEYYRGEAEDWGKVVGLNETVQVPYGNFTGCLKTEDWNGLEGRGNSLEYKYYCRNLGTAAEQPAGDAAERVALMQFTR
jgi:hypothetical protein